ncbi:MAG: hypothetical protein QXU52_00930 [Fervidicoccaceae archaeon]
MGRGRAKREELRRELVELIEESRDSWIKAAFFSDPTVANLLEELHERWAGSGGVGAPLDYAEQNELEELVTRARRYSSMSSSEAARLVIERMTGSPR